MERERWKNFTAACKTWCKNIGFLPGALIAVAFSSWLIFANLENLGCEEEFWKLGLSVLAASLAVLGAIHVIYTFTRELPDHVDSGNKDKKRHLPIELRNVFVYGYIFMITSLALCAAPFLISPSQTSNPNASAGPAGIVLGCRSEDCNSDQEQSPQWFLHIGSNVSGPKAARQEAQKSESTQSKEDVKGAGGIASYAVLKGGLAVPLYVVLLALAGGAVSLTRRLPEYQRQAAGDSTEKPDSSSQPRISTVRARELVIFQIMQVFTAPLIAIVAFAVFNPDTVLAGALLGFLSGFASETILLRLRATADALSGQGNGQPSQHQPGTPGAGGSATGNQGQQKQGSQHG